MTGGNPTKVALIQERLREAAAKIKAEDAIRVAEAEISPEQAEELDRVTFIGPALEESFSATTLLDLISEPMPLEPAKPRDLNDLYDRIGKLNNGVAHLMREAPQSRCMLAADVRTEMNRVKARLDEIDSKEAKLKVGPLRLTFKWSALITAIVLLAEVPWTSWGSILFGLFF